MRHKRQITRTALGKAIYDARRAKDMTQHTLSKALHVQQITVSNWEYGLTKPARYGLASIARALGIDVATLENADAADAAGEREANQHAGNK